MFRTIGDLLFVFQPRPAVPPLVPVRGAVPRPVPGFGHAAAGAQPARAGNG